MEKLSLSPLHLHAMNLPWLSETPFTADLIERFNHLTMHPVKLEEQNQSFVDQRQAEQQIALKRLLRFGHSTIPSDVQTCLNWVAKARYERFVAVVRARELAPGTYLTGASNYRKNFTERKEATANNLEDKARGLVTKAEEKLRLAIERYGSKALISSDDPDAVEQLARKLEKCEQLQTLMKAVNKVVGAKKLDRPTKEAQVRVLLVEAGCKEDNVDSKVSSVFETTHGELGFPKYKLKNNGAEIRRLKKRIEELRERENDVTRTVDISATENSLFTGTITVTDNVEENRFQIEFPKNPGKEMCQTLGQHGFVWRPSESVWQRKRGPNAQYAAEQALGMTIQFDAAEEAALSDDPEPEPPHPTQATFTKINGAGHGWLVVPVALVQALGVNVTRCSHISTDQKTAYLEEDKDLKAFWLAFEAKFGQAPLYKDDHQPNTFVPNLSSYPQSLNQPCEEN